MHEQKKHKKAAWQWRPWFAWHPKRINGRWYWGSYVYRYFVLSPGGGFYRYGDSLDVLKNKW